MFRYSLLSWYKKHGRHDLPWRNTDDPYHVYVSEIMLQQTQVASVKERFYPPFLSQFPSLTALAEAEEQDVLKAWQGLGYYRRAKYLHACAIQTTPALPESVENLIKLPGIGRYTAGAIRCFGHRKYATLVDTNIKRVFSRITASEDLSEKQLYEIAEQLVPPDDYYDFNQALLDVGATLCTAKKAACLLCPLNNLCEGKDSPYSYPAPKIKKIVPEREAYAAIIKNNHKIALIKRDTAFLGGYYTLPPLEHKPETEPVGIVTQTYSHFKSHITLFSVDNTGGYVKTPLFTKEEAENLPLSAIDKKMIAIAFKKN